MSRAEIGKYYGICKRVTLCKCLRDDPSILASLEIL